jgi:hypothetical protein
VAEAEHILAVNYFAAHRPTAAALAMEEVDPTADAVGAAVAAERRIAGVPGERWGCIGCGLQGCSLRRTERIAVDGRGIVIVVGSFLVGVVGVDCIRHSKAGRRIVAVT